MAFSAHTATTDSWAVTETHHYSGASLTTWNKERDGLFRSDDPLVREQLARKYKI